MVRTIICLVAVLFSLTLSAPPSLADGKVFARYAAVPPPMPDQQAIVAFDAAAGVQTMAVESRFVPAATGTEHAWVVPLPGPDAPIITQATPGLFPTTRAVFLPRVVAAGSGTGFVFTVFLVGMLGILLIACVVRGTLANVLGFVFFTIVMIGIFLPALGKARSASPSSDGVAELARESIGAYDISVVAAADGRDSGAELRAWLAARGFELPASVQPVLADYAAKGWVFAACRLDPSKAADPVAAAPLVFTFRTPQPVYPMRLTGVGNGDLDVDLYVFADGRAEAPGFDVVRCSRVMPDASGGNRLRTPASLPDDASPLVIGHEALLALAGGRSVATQLRARLTPEQQRDDVVIQLGTFRPTGGTKYTRDGSMARALDIAAPTCVAALAALLAIGALRKQDAGWALRRAGVVLAAGGVLWGVMVGVTPITTDVRRVDRGADYWRFRGHQLVSFRIADVMSRIPTDGPPEAALAAARAAVQAEWRTHELVPEVREEDSPGNYTLRLVDGRVEYTGYSPTGLPIERVLVWP